jgi:hypothetical protein
VGLRHGDAVFVAQLPSYSARRDWRSTVGRKVNCLARWSNDRPPSISYSTCGFKLRRWCRTPTV